MKRTDALIVILALVIAGCFFAFNELSARDDAQMIRISVDGKPYLTVPLDKPQRIVVDIDGRENAIEITGHGARMIEANCPDKLCVHQGEITKSNQTIVCLPNKVVVEFVGDQEGELDAISE